MMDGWKGRKRQGERGNILYCKDGKDRKKQRKEKKKKAKKRKWEERKDFFKSSGRVAEEVVD